MSTPAEKPDWDDFSNSAFNMQYMYIYFVIYFLAYSVLLFFIGTRGLIMHKPTVLNSKVNILLLTFAIIPYLIISAVIIKLGVRLFDFEIFLPLVFVAIFVYRLFIMKGYNIFCVNDDDFRNAIIATLNTRGIKFEEKMNAIDLPELGNQINIVYASWVGNGTIRLKNKKDEKLFNEIIADIKNYHKNHSKTSKKMYGVFSLLFGFLCFIACAALAYYFIFMAY